LVRSTHDKVADDREVTIRTGDAQRRRSFSFSFAFTLALLIGWAPGAASHQTHENNIVRRPIGWFYLNASPSTIGDID